MGIHGLTKLIADKAPGAIKEHKMDSYFGRKIAVDASMSIYQFLIAVRQGEQGQLTNEADVAKGSRANASGCQPELSGKRRKFSGQVGPKSARHAGTITSCCPPESATLPKFEPADSTQTRW